MAKRLFFSSLAFFSLFLCCSLEEREKWQTSTFLYFDTVCEINILCFPSTFDSCQREIHGVFSEIEGSFSPGADYHSSPLVLDLYHKALKIYQDSEGSFDVTVAPLLRLWGFYNKSYRLPAPNEIKEQLDYIGMDKIQERNGILVLLPNMDLDWGGIAKGLGVDIASHSLQSIGIKRGFINAGGDLFCWGQNPENRAWKIGIKHPRKRGYFGVLSISNLGAATTGDYQRFFEIEKVRYHHVFDPLTGYPAKGKQSVTVVGPETFVCDALSTALFVSRDPEEILEMYPDYGAIIMDSNGKVTLLGKAYPFSPI